MATGDQADFESRLRSLLPPSWFPDGAESPVLDIILAGTAYNLAWDDVLFNYVLLQERIATATGVWLDRISFDFCGTRLPRLSGESDNAYRKRILAEILRPRQTRQGITQALVDLTGRAPKLIELWNPSDTGGYGIAGQQGYSQAGIYGSLLFHNQILVTAYRPSGVGDPGIPGYHNVVWGYGAGNGPGEYTSIVNVAGKVKDSDIDNAVAQIIAAGNIAWLTIRSTPDTIDAPQFAMGNISNSSYDALVPGFFF